MNELAINLMRLRKLNNMTQQDVADAAGISRVAYRNLEKGDAEPREGTLQALAKALNASAFDLLAPVPKLQSLRFRANKEMSTQQKAQGNQVVVRTGNWLQDFNELETALNDHRPNRLKTFRKGTKPKSAAQKLRKQLIGPSTGCDCITDICELLEEAGIKIFMFDFQMPDCSGLSIGPADGGPAIAINTGKGMSVERQIFSIAHELGHLVMHQESYGKQSDELTQEEENEADAFAAEFLMPEELFSKEWSENRGLHWVDAILKTKRHFRISSQSVIRQLIQMGKAEHPTAYKKFRADYKERFGKELHWKEEPRPLDPLDLMEDRLDSLVRDALDQELITVSRAAEILDLHIEEMRERMKSWEVVS
jgi:Zn-dependent peptidase ImmA (M78 family)/transcriptional regulator with XRE-family HTH domain